MTEKRAPGSKLRAFRAPVGPRGRPRPRPDPGRRAPSGGSIRGRTQEIATDPKSESLWSAPVVLLALATFVGFQLLLSVVPLYAGSDGGSSGAGLATAAFMLSTVLTQIQMPRLMERFG